MAVKITASNLVKNYRSRRQKQELLNTVMTKDVVIQTSSDIPGTAEVVDHQEIPHALMKTYSTHVPMTQSGILVRLYCSGPPPHFAY